MAEYICVECGEKVSNLFVEFSPGNIKLTRCDACGQVADKYIEHELVIILMDIVLHRVPAYRHLYRNRRDLWLINNFQNWLICLVIVLNIVLKLVILQKPYGDNKYFDPSRVFQLFFIATLEYSCLLVGYILVVCGSEPGRRSLALSANKWRMYLALTFPEVMKAIAIVLQLFDCEPSMLFLLGMLIVSVQHGSLQSVLRIPLSVLIVGAFVAITLKLLVRVHYHNISDVWEMGVIL